MQEENELHERLAELQRKEQILMSRGRDQIKQGAHICTACNNVENVFMLGSLFSACTLYMYIGMSSSFT